MSISNLMPHSVDSPSLPYRLAPCAKAISVLFLVLSSPASWASADTLRQLQEDLNHWSQPKPQEKKLNSLPAPKNQKSNDFGFGTMFYELAIGLPESLSEISKINENQLIMRNKWLELAEKDAKYLVNRIKHIKDKTLDEKKFRETQIPPTAPSKDTAPSTINEKVDDREDALLSGINNLYTEATDVSKTIYSVVDNILAAEPESTAKAVVEPKTAEKAPISPAKVAQAPVLKLAPAPKPAPIISHNPQAGSYIANQLATQQMFMTDDLQYRQGETLYTDPITGETDVSSLWLNTTGSKSRFSSGHGQLNTKSSRYAVQLGGTLSKWSSGGNDQGLLGLTAGVGKSTNHSRSTSSHHQAQGSVDGYNLGLYSIWYADNHSKTGPYIDLLAQHSWFNNHIAAPKVATGANYRSYLFTTALETGYKLQLIETADTRFFIQPKAKMSWQRTSGLLHNESDTQIKVDENNAVTTKLGMRTAWEFDIDTLSSTRTLQISPSFEANWIYSRMSPGVQLSDIYITPAKLQNKTELASIHVTPQGTRNIADLKVGIEANINKNLLVWTHLGHQFGSHNYGDTQATLGANYRF